jgi:RNA methyltransferase, TrmH family
VRHAERRFLVEGPQSVSEALAAGPPGSAGALVELFVTAAAAAHHLELMRTATAVGVPIRTVSPDVAASLTETVTPQGVVGVAQFLDMPLEQALAGRPRLVAVLAAIRDPGNAGTVLRCADAAGADAVVFTADSVDVYNGKCVRASVGSLFHLPVVVGATSADTLDALRARGLRVLAADGTGDTDLDDLVDAGDLEAPTGWLFGNEAWGLPAALSLSADLVVGVPIHGRAESLNLAAAAAVCLYASARAQRRPRR